MTKKRAAETPSTHFEQVSVAVAKTIAQGDIAPAQPGKDKVAVELGDRKTSPAPHFHAVQFYESPDALCRIVGSFLGEGLEQGAVSVLIVTPDHAARIEACLRQGAVDVDALKRAGELVVVDARDTLNKFMVDGMPKASEFRHTVGGLLLEMRRNNDNRPIRAYGEMVDLLWKDGREAAAIRLETLWNQLASSYDFALLCGYSMGNFYKGSTLEDIKRQHTHLVPTAGGVFVPILAPPADAQA